MKSKSTTHTEQTKSLLYAYVFHQDTNRTSLKWFAKVGAKAKCSATERGAAIEADIMLIKAGKQPVNVLKPKTA